jgi:hypothetical protein
MDELFAPPGYAWQRISRLPFDAPADTLLFVPILFSIPAWPSVYQRPVVDLCDPVGIAAAIVIFRRA